MNEVFDLNYEDVVDEKYLLSSKNLMKSGSKLKVQEVQGVFRNAFNTLIG
jgi:hypothetical protein